MPRREVWLSAGLVFLVALAVRAWAATQVVFPQPEDTAYYVDVARNLLSGHGLVADAIWSYNTPPLSFNPPRPAFEVWLPMATFLDAIPMALLGATFAAAQVASILVGSTVCVLAWRLGADVATDLELSPGRARTLAVGAGLAAAVYLPLVLFSVQPDSTMPFAALTLGAVLVARRALLAIAIREPEAPPRRKMPRADLKRRRIVTAPPEGRRRGRGWGVDLGDRGRWWLVAVGVLIGLAAWTRNDAVWLALVWAIVGWRATRPAGGWRSRLRPALVVVGLPAVVAFAVYLPWLLRDWAVFGNPLPGQAALNALFLDGRDVFAWAEPPTLDRYLNAGLLTLVGLRVTGFLHNLGSVLLLLGIPVSALGLLGLPWAARAPSLRPLLGFALTAFLVATLVFPVATTWGTFLHAAGAIHVLVIVSALLVLDRLIERVRTARDWTRPVAWLGPAAAVTTSLALTLVLVPPQGADGRDTQARYAALPAALASAGAPLPTDGSPVITDFPIWLATEDGVHALALPNERPAEVLDLANHFGATMVIVDQNDEGQWPEVLDQEEPGSECFKLVPLQVDGSSPLADTVVFQIVCSGGTPGTP